MRESNWTALKFFNGKVKKDKKMDYQHRTICFLSSYFTDPINFHTRKIPLKGKIKAF